MARVLIARAPHQASALAEGLRARGVEAVLVPSIELAPPTSFAPLDAAIQALQQQGTEPPFHWLIFTSANAVEAFATRLACPLSLVPYPCSIAVIGPATARAVASLLGQAPTLVPPQAVAESLAAALLAHALQPDGSPTRFLLVRAEQARDVLPEALRAAGADVTIVSAYRTVVPQDSLPLVRGLFHSPSTCPDAIAFTSSSTATNLLALLDAAGLALPPDVLRVSIGPITSQTLRGLGLPAHAEAAEPTVAALVEILVKTLVPSETA